MGSTVTLQELLAARDSRAARQRELLAQYGRPVVSFCMNIAGPVKQSPVICRGFREGQERLAAPWVRRGSRSSSARSGPPLQGARPSGSWTARCGN